ncbi:MAG: hypothetical protein ACFCGT_20665 [Sandaracinaceae bacterium]
MSQDAQDRVEAARDEGRPADHHDLPLFLEQYKVFVDSALKVTDWRTSANGLFLTLNTLLLPALGLRSPLAGERAVWIGLVCGVGLALALTWVVLLRHYRRLSRAKFEVISRMERRLPYAPFGEEWKLLTPRDGSYVGLSKMESVLPALFAAVYLLALISLLIGGAGE